MTSARRWPADGADGATIAPSALRQARSDKRVVLPFQRPVFRFEFVVAGLQGAQLRIERDAVAQVLDPARRIGEVHAFRKVQAGIVLAKSKVDIGAFRRRQLEGNPGAAPDFVVQIEGVGGRAPVADLVCPRRVKQHRQFEPGDR
jgi:hypothetical protein